MIPVTATEFAALMAPLGPFEAAPIVAVAVSGGSDSLALALLASEWARDRGGQAVALTVDHRLRSESTAEAETVGVWLKKNAIPHTILPWLTPKPASDIQAAARSARYALLEDWCHQAGILHLLLAHHQDDQAETLLMRLGRGSGVDGLSSMQAIRETIYLRRLRPLLDVPRARLTATLVDRGQLEWVDDPSNRNPAYARIRLRQAFPSLEALGLIPARLAATAARMGRAREALEDMTAQAVLRGVTTYPAGYAMIDREYFRTLPDEVALRLLARLLQAVGGGNYPPRLERLERLFLGMRTKPEEIRTLAGCRCGPHQGGILVSREVSKVQGPVALEPGETTLWDGRFRLALAHDAQSGLVIRALGLQGWRKLAAVSQFQRLPPIPAAVRPTLPVIADETGVSAVPHVSYNRGGGAESVVRCVISATCPMTAALRRLARGSDGIISRVTLGPPTERGRD